MKHQLLKEWNQLMHAWSVRIIFLLFLAGGIILAVSSDITSYRAPFMGYYWGPTGLILFAAIVAGQVAGEYQNGRAVIAAAEAGKKCYFAAKTMGLFGLVAFFYLAYIVVSCLFCYWLNGPGSGYFSYYPLQIAVFLFWRILACWVYIAIFLLICVIMRRSFWSYALSCGTVFLEVFLWLRQQQENRPTTTAGPMTALMQSEKYIGMADFLSYEYAILFVPSLYAGILALILAYYIFRRRKKQTRPPKRSPRLLVGKMLGAVMMSALFLFCSQTRLRAEESTTTPAGLQSMENVGELRLIYGDNNLDDKDAFVLLLMAEGFTETEQADFFKMLKHSHRRLCAFPPIMNFQT